MSNNQIKPNIHKARALGSIAFAMEINAPALDVTMMSMLAGRKVGDPRNIPELKAWIGGWTSANLACFSG